VIGKPNTCKGGRVLAGLALCVCITACDSGEEARGPGVASEGETAALSDAREMLDARPPKEEPATEEGAGETGNE